MGNYTFKLGDTYEDNRQRAITCVYSFGGVISVNFYPQMNALLVFGEGFDETEIQRKVDEIYNPNKEKRCPSCDHVLNNDHVLNKSFA
ncbi:PREDICTED: uncharacterized protein LOC104750147 [Camelina sativa]|uniref:Uncharacterized protein LOC104750147 n=1 Tax=Camelina sativa TaxID=90675 RepID=A0ABM1R2M2_CAMSA|nr:PREDICTED: uncharacterized protein LOC104750147 [Camelina sativa]